MQYRAGRAMVYELDCKGRELCLWIFAPNENDDVQSYRIEARRGRSPDAACISESGATCEAALLEVARVWRERALLDDQVDWEAVTKALTSVRAM
jgi:hypothetical protein